MNIDDLIENYEAQVVAGEVLAPVNGKIETVGKLFDTQVALNDLGKSMVEMPKPRRRGRPPRAEVATEVTTEATGLNLDVTDSVSTEEVAS